MRTAKTRKTAAKLNNTMAIMFRVLLLTPGRIYNKQLRTVKTYLGENFLLSTPLKLVGICIFSCYVFFYYYFFFSIFFFFFLGGGGGGGGGRKGGVCVICIHLFLLIYTRT